MPDEFIKLAIQIFSASKKKKKGGWSSGVDAKKHTKNDIFAEGNAHEIAEYLYNIGKSKAMNRLNFYINRAGKNLSSSRLNTLESAKNILSQKIKQSKD